jgi:hypothetical protein
MLSSRIFSPQDETVALLNRPHPYFQLTEDGRAIGPGGRGED